ncbi:MAG: di-trans,poly-cis-decaprenylcistransferase [Planctomycetota bacterium]|nr:MAG: di-trans,poly-cis-decaprenylcistransferase [Planctomycetota bacterium]
MKPDFPVPEHVAIIMDGNGRWARRSGWLRLRGHEGGAEAVRDVTEAAAEWGVKHLTLYAFSMENWQRPQAEVDALMRLLQRYLKKELRTLLDNGVRLQAIGRLQDLKASVRQALADTEAKTAHGKAMTLRLALSYGGRQEILDGIRRLLAESPPDRSIQQEDLAAVLYDPSMPDPDLVIRTAGEQRLSNFLLWQASYAELYFTDVLWPDFRRQHLLAALKDYHGRVRRFGKVLENDPAVHPSSS